MGEIRLQCNGCAQELSLPGTAAGKKAKCPHCQTVFDVDAQTPSLVLASPMQANPYSSPALEESTKSGGDFKPAQFKANNPPPLGLMTIPLYISGVLYLLIGLGVMAALAFTVSGSDGEVPLFLVGIWAVCGLFCFALAGFIFFFTSKLRQRKKWAWITAIAFGGLYTPSAFIFMGVPILIGALKPEVQAWFNTD